ncbi:hypothetical protein [Dethiobacter alkaliphilus]|uniref:Uncharacterized protein n=1 Tax=Dethiobacter alkaliphilus AHT 1 TaxID=555088 RepID=C0GET6_DETAL|nr:hypothetical protein [Dethiobacter alkaliphilus]EEG78118.1 hypothetical protein DealDRAFT_0995 [Dethiobacter alkaliphilus AHT 1]
MGIKQLRELSRKMAEEAILKNCRDEKPSPEMRELMKQYSSLIREQCELDRAEGTVIREVEGCPEYAGLTEEQEAREKQIEIEMREVCRAMQDLQEQGRATV